MSDGATPEPAVEVLVPKRRGLKPSKAEKSAAQAAMPYHDVPIPNKNGTPSSRTLPIQQMTREVYQRESRSLAYNHFVKGKSFTALKLALSRHGSDRALRFLSALINPKNKGVDVADLAEKHGISYNDLMTVWQNDRLSAALAHLYDGAVTVAEHIVKDAESTYVCCSRCDGSGVMRAQYGDTKAKWVKCVNCNGAGITRKVGDSKSRQQVLEATGIVKSGGGVTVNVGSSAASAVDSVLDEMEGITIPVTAE
jgi:hypothetical protein